MKHAADPSPRSPADVLADRTNYVMIECEQQANQIVRLIVLHRGTETHWQAHYGLYAAQLGTSWTHVEPQKITVVRWRKVV